MTQYGDELACFPDEKCFVLERLEYEISISVSYSEAKVCRTCFCSHPFFIRYWNSFSIGIVSRTTEKSFLQSNVFII